MTGLPSSEAQLFEAFLKSAQYLVRLQSQQDIWEHVGKFVLTHFSANWLALIERDPGQGLVLGYCTLPEESAGQAILTPEVRTLIGEVLESGFLASQILFTPSPSMTAFLPIVGNYQSSSVMLVGHRDAQPLSNELLNIYLALAGLAGATTERRQAEDATRVAGEEVRRLNADLEGRVAERTGQLRKANGELLKEIVERQRVEEELRQNREWLRVTLASIGDAVLTTDTRGLVTFLNPVAEALTGWSAEEAQGQRIQSVFPIVNEQTRVSAEDLVAGVLKEGRAVELANHTVLRTRDGRELPIEDSAAPILDRSGVALGVVLVFHDVADRRRAQQEREITIEFLRLVNENAGTRDLIRAAASFFQEQSGCQAVGIRLREEDDYPYYEARGFPKEFIRLENSLCARDVNGEVVRDQLGDSVVECMCGNVIRGRFDPAKPFFTENGSFWTNSTTHLLATTNEANRQSPTRNRCNGEGYESVALIPLRVGQQHLGLLQLNDHQPNRFTPPVLSLWERLAGHLAIALANCRVEEALKQSEGRYRDLFNTLIEGFCVIEVIFDVGGCPVDYRFLEINPAFEKQTGLHDAEGKLMRDLAPEHEAHWFEIYGKIAQTGEPARFQNEAKALNRWFEVFAYRVGGPESRKVAILFNDITERKQAEQALIRNEKLASVGRMAAAIAHEINNPLAAVTNVLYLAKGAPDLPASTREYLEIADAELKRVAHIARQSLGFYRESNLPATTSINAVLDSAVDLLKSRIKAKHAVIEKQWHEEVEVTAVAGELRQVFSNLLANSLDAIEEEGTIKLRVSAGLTFGNGDPRVRVTVADNGNGISEGARRHLFEPFFTTKDTTGTGLGLWVSKQLIDKHGGTIRMRSRTNGGRRGTVFSVVLPSQPTSPHSQSTTA
jgi:PAS domain S-box-containing protein